MFDYNGEEYQRERHFKYQRVQLLMLMLVILILLYDCSRLRNIEYASFRIKELLEAERDSGVNCSDCVESNNIHNKDTVQ